jgi:hypothetical protein
VKVKARKQLKVPDDPYVVISLPYNENALLEMVCPLSGISVNSCSRSSNAPGNAQNNHLSRRLLLHLVQGNLDKSPASAVCRAAGMGRLRRAARTSIVGGLAVVPASMLSTEPKLRGRRQPARNPLSFDRVSNWPAVPKWCQRPYLQPPPHPRNPGPRRPDRNLAWSSCGVRPGPYPFANPNQDAHVADTIEISDRSCQSAPTHRTAIMPEVAVVAGGSTVVANRPSPRPAMG